MKPLLRLKKKRGGKHKGSPKSRASPKRKKRPFSFGVPPAAAGSAVAARIAFTASAAAAGFHQGAAEFVTMALRNRRYDPKAVAATLAASDAVGAAARKLLDEGGTGQFATRADKDRGFVPGLQRTATRELFEDRWHEPVARPPPRVPKDVVMPPTIEKMLELLCETYQERVRPVMAAFGNRANASVALRCGTHASHLLTRFPDV